jgi:hypothetical protein
MQIAFLLITGPAVEPAVIKFSSGLNIVNGPSNTGKSHILRLIDFALGAKESPEPPPEQLGYDMVHLGVRFSGVDEKTIVRPLQGGEIVVLDGLQNVRPQENDGEVFSAQHRSHKSISKYLLEKIGAKGAKIRTDAKGKTRELSFRDILKICIVDEASIQKSTSPILTGQFVTKTAELSVFKYVLMGIDDAALDISQRDPNQELKQAAQLELIDRQLRELDKEIEESTTDYDALKSTDSQLDAQLEENFNVQERSEGPYRALLTRRRVLRTRYEESTSRALEIQTLLMRFELLEAHYASDQKRLTAIQEAGQYYTLESEDICPVCGANPDDHKPQQACDGDIERISRAAAAELLSLAERSKELTQTINYLTEKLVESEELASQTQIELDAVGSEIANEMPGVRTVRGVVQDLLTKKLSNQRSLDVVRRRDRLSEQRVELGVGKEVDSSTLVAQNQLDGTMLDKLCQRIENELQSWQFPNAARVFFDVGKLDISVGGKSRSINGKGVRALLHGAFSIGLLKFTAEHRRPHPGFLVLDSLFVTYRDPDGDEEKSIKASPLKDRALEALCALGNDLQVIVVENVSVPDSIERQSFYHHFTGTVGVGRFGLFPVPKIAIS